MNNDLIELGHVNNECLSIDKWNKIVSKQMSLRSTKKRPLMLIKVYDKNEFLQMVIK